MKPFSQAKPLELRSRKTAISSLIKHIDDPGKCSSTGISKLDTAMGGGLYAGKAYGLQARKKVGKTILLGTISHNLNKAGVKHLWVAAEMNDQELEQRQIARDLGRNPIDFLKNKVSVEDLTEYKDMAPDNTVYANASGAHLDVLEKTIEKAVVEEGINGVIIDYLQLIRGVSQNRTEHLEYVAQSVAVMVRKYDIWAFVAAQLNQEDNTRGGEGMLLAFDMVFNLHRQKTESGAWLEMCETRYTNYMNIGSKGSPGLRLESSGPYFAQV
tara:strand:+ start:691 stop:1500 length:810 start_codon:yes stop_codon:yes gene_type:complete